MNQENKPAAELIVSRSNIIKVDRYEGTCLNCFCKVIYEKPIWLYLFEKIEDRLNCIAIDSVTCSYCGFRLIWFTLKGVDTIKSEYNGSVFELMKEKNET